MEKTIFPHGDDTEKCCLSLTSVSVSNSKFSFLFCQTLTRSKKKRSWGRVSGAEFQKQSKHGETQMLALATLKAAAHILFDSIDKRFSDWQS